VPKRSHEGRFFEHGEQHFGQANPPLAVCNQVQVQVDFIPQAIADGTQAQTGNALAPRQVSNQSAFHIHCGRDLAHPVTQLDLRLGAFHRHQLRLLDIVLHAKLGQLG
jgi:hypothetical protein